MRYGIIVNGQYQPYTDQKLKQDHPKRLWPDPITDHVRARFGMYPVALDPRPAYNPATERLEVGDIVVDGAGFRQTWRVVLLTQVEIDAATQERRGRMRVPRLAARLELIDSGLWSGIPAIIAAIPDETERAYAEAFFEDARHWERTDPHVQSIGAALGLSDTDLDDLFVRAASR